MNDKYDPVSRLDFDLGDRVAIITGAASGIGTAIAKAFTKSGARVAAVDRDIDRLKKVVDEMNSSGGTAIAIETELTDTDAITRVVETSLENFGKINVLVHCAGIFAPLPFDETTREDFIRHMDVNLLAPFALSRLALPHLEPGSAIIFVTSTTERIGSPYTTAYAASKAALSSMMRVMAVELAARDICVNAVSPGFTATPMNEFLRSDQAIVDEAIACIPAGRLAEPEDIAPSVVFLASKGARYIQGMILGVEGGYPSTPDVNRIKKTEP